ncbi:MAG: four helix bundle protein [Bacteroidales bacterium]|nr:four helix bundle protein [Bacteroidales bacterium]HNW73302.1 four helix bundle protein [Bacteroidales bacterium]
MFDFEKLDLYQIVKNQNVKVLTLLKSNVSIDPYLVEQWKRSSLGIMLNLVEGTGRMADQDKRNFLTIARGNVYEAVAILNLLKDLQLVTDSEYSDLYQGYESCSKMLLAMYRSYAK